MLVVGAIGLVFAMLRLGHWAQVPLILCAWFVDQTLSSLLIAPFDLQSSHELLSAWPFILTTLSTAVVAGVLAFALPDRPYFYGVSMVSLDLVMAWVFRAAAPFALTPSLIARLVSAYGAAVFGASLGKRIRLLTKRGAGQARQFAREVVIEVAGGMLVALAVYWLLPA